MKKCCALLLCCMMILTLCGCGSSDSDILFYYTRREFSYGTQDGVIASEIREAPGHEDDLTYLLTMYLEGPLDQKLSSPFPKGTALEGFTYSDATMYVTLNEAFAQLESMDHTIASACVAYTCFNLTSAESVVIKCNSEEYGNRSITLSRDDMILFDDSTATLPTAMEG